MLKALGRVGQVMFSAIHSKIRREVLLCALLLAVLPAGQGCGDKLIGLGGGAPFARIHPWPYVAQILFYIRPQSPLLALNRTGPLADRPRRPAPRVSLSNTHT